MTMSQHSPQSLCYGKLSFPRQTSAIIQHPKTLVDSGTPFSGEKYANAIVKLQEGFDHRFVNFK